MTGKTRTESRIPRKEPNLEQVSIPPDRSFFWRKHDYPMHLAVWNSHPEIEIHLIRYTSGLAYVGDYIGPFEPGNLCVIGSNLPHSWTTQDVGQYHYPDRDLVVQFDPAPILQGCHAFPEFSIIIPFLDRTSQGLMFGGETARAARQLLESLEGVPPGQATARILEILHILASSEEFQVLASRQFVQSSRRVSPEQHDKLECALSYIQDRVLENPRMEEIADLVGMSPSVFSRFFKRRTGNTFTEHLVTLRVSSAQKYLIETEEPVTAICYLSGFNNISNFNRTFRRKVGMAPSAYRYASRRVPT